MKKDVIKLHHVSVLKIASGDVLIVGLPEFCTYEYGIRIGEMLRAVIPDQSIKIVITSDGIALSAIRVLPQTHVEATGASPKTVSCLRRVLKKLNTSIERRAVAAVVNAKRPGGATGKAL